MQSYDLLIIGGGPAALAAATYAHAKHLRVAMIYEQFGGKTAWPHGGDATMDPLPGNDVVGLFAIQVKAHAITTVHDQVKTLVKDGEMFMATTSRHGPYTARTVLVATGATPKRLYFAGNPYLLGQGLGYSLTTFAHQVVGQRVAVIGVTPRTVRGIVEMLDSAAHIYLITADSVLPDLPLLKALRHAPQVEIMTDTVVRDVVGLTTIKSIQITRGPMVESLPVNRLFIDLGLTPNTQFLAGLPITDAAGFIIVDDYNRTAIDGLFAAGDVTTSVFGEQVLIAVGDGVRAANSAYESILNDRLAVLVASAVGENR